MTKKKLLFVAPTTELKAGGEISHFELLKAVKKHGYSLHVIVRGKGTLTRELKNVSIPFTIIPFSNWGPSSVKIHDGLYDFTAIQAISTIIKKGKIDCVITNTLNMPWGALAAALTNTPHIWIVREYPFEEFSYLKEKYDFINNFSNTVLANSKNLAVYMNTNYHTKAKYFYSYVDVGGLKLSNHQGDPRIIMIGHIFARKNQLDLLKAAAVLQKDKLLKNKIVFVGASDDTYKQVMDNFIKKHSLEKYIQFVGYRKQPYSIVKKNDIIIQTSRSESIGRTPIEAMKLGLTVIGADILGTREAFQLGGGLLYRADQPKDLAKKITTVLSNQEKYMAKTKLIQNKVNENLSEQACHKNFFIELEKVFNHPNPQGHLQQLSPYLQSLATTAKDNRKIILHYQKSLAEHQYHLNNILNSRSWKLVKAVKRFFKYTQPGHRE